MRRQLLIFLIFLVHLGYGQGEIDTTKSSKMYIIIKNDGTEFVGRIISQDAREVLIQTDKLGEVFIPKHEIKEIRELKPGELNSRGEFIPSDLFSTRYFFTTNGLPLEKGDSYILFSLFGPDVQFGIAKNLSVGVITSWVGIPIIGSVKYSHRISENASFAGGLLLGTGSWAAPDFGIAAPYGALTFGGSRSNITFSAGYGSVFNDGEGEGRALISVSGLTKFSRKASFVFESIVVPGNNNTFALIIPGLRLQTKKRAAFQFGFAGAAVDGEFVPVPVPFVQWFLKL